MGGIPCPSTRQRHTSSTQFGPIHRLHTHTHPQDIHNVHVFNYFHACMYVIIMNSLVHHFSSVIRTGSASFKSLQTYGSGWFSMNIKMPQKDSTGVITTFYVLPLLMAYHINFDNLIHGFNFDIYISCMHACMRG